MMSMIKRCIRFCLSFLLIGTLCAFAEEGARIISLNDAIRLALEHNRDLQSSRDRVKSSNITVGTEKSDFRIKVRPEISGLYQQNEELDQYYALQVSKQLYTGGELIWKGETSVDNSVFEEYQTDLIFGYTQPLLRGRGTLPTTNRLVTAEQNSRIQYRSFLIAQQRLTVLVAASYHGILRDQMLIGVAERAIERSKLLLQAAEAKLKVGMASKMDVFRAELQLLTAENGLVDVKASLENSTRRFNLLLGTEMETEYTFSSPLEYQPITPDQDRLIQQSMENRLEIKNARERVEEAERQLKVAKQRLLPPLDVSVQYTLRGQGDALEESLEMEDDFWGIGINSSFDLDFARERAAYQQTQIAVDETVRTLQSTQDDIIAEVLQTIVSVMQAEASVNLQEQSMRQAEQQLELSALRYKKGLSDNLDVVNAEENFVQAKINYYSAIVQHLNAEMRLKQVTGTLKVPPQ